MASDSQNQDKEQLNSYLEIDYTQLCSLLVKRNWKAADEETKNLMLKVAGVERKRVRDIINCSEGIVPATDKLPRSTDYLDSYQLAQEDFECFSCIDFLIIDSFWVKYSEGRFGFSVQNRIYKEGDETSDIAQKLGWAELDINIPFAKYGVLNYFMYKDLVFDITAPLGHLPAFFINWEVYSYLPERISSTPWILSNINSLYSLCERCGL